MSVRNGQTFNSPAVSSLHDSKHTRSPNVVNNNYHHFHHHCLQGIFKDLRYIANTTVVLPELGSMWEVMDGGGNASVNDP